MSRAPLVVAGILIEICLIGMLILGDLSRNVPIFFVLFFSAFGIYLAAVWRARAAHLKLAFLFGLIFRATLLPSTPSLSDDIYRYLWDARVQSETINPYKYAPGAPELAHLREDTIYPRVNHPDVPTIYPPLAQITFLASTLLSPTVWALKLFLVGLDLLTAWLLIGLLRTYDLHTGRILIYLWNPLLILEVAGNGHMDILGVTFLILSFLYVSVGGTGRAACALGLSVLGKGFAICLLPMFLRWAHARSHSEERPAPKAWPFVLFGGTVSAGVLPYADVGWGLFAGLWIYAKHWEFNASVYGLLNGVLELGDLSRVAVGVLFLGAVLALTFKNVHPIRSGYLLAGLFVLLTPTLHPWYLIWIIPFLVFYASPAWLVFTGLVALSYHVLIQFRSAGIWEEAGWVKAVEYGGFIAVWIAERMWRELRKEKGPPVGEGPLPSRASAGENGL